MFNDVVATLFWRDRKQFRKGFVPYPHIKSVETFCQRYVKFLLVILKRSQCTTDDDDARDECKDFIFKLHAGRAGLIK